MTFYDDLDSDFMFCTRPNPVCNQPFDAPEELSELRSDWSVLEPWTLHEAVVEAKMLKFLPPGHRSYLRWSLSSRYWEYLYK